MTRLDDARAEHERTCQIIAEGEFLSNYRGHHETRDKLWAEIKRLETEHAKELAAEAALEFLRDHGQYLQEICCGGLPRAEIDSDLDRVMGRIKELEGLEDEL